MMRTAALSCTSISLDTRLLWTLLKRKTGTGLAGLEYMGGEKLCLSISLANTMFHKVIICVVTWNICDDATIAVDILIVYVHTFLALRENRNTGLYWLSNY